MITFSTNNDYISHPLLKKDYVSRREYQEKIFINCLNHNCLVVIPTGLGKTIIALMLAVYRLEEFPKSKVIFLAPTKPLVEQHHRSFLDLTLLPPESLQSLTGTIIPQKRKNIWNQLRVAFMTPQVLQNDIISGLYSLEEVSLIIFDECHRAVGDYAYVFIAQKYMEKSKGHQILGLTASPGSTQEKIKEIKENLFIDQIEIRTDKDSDVKDYVQKVDNEWIKISLPEEFLEIKKLLEEKLKEIYKWLKEKELLDSYDLNKITRKDLLQLNAIINRRIGASQDDNEKYDMFYAKKLQANAIRLSHMLELLETQGINALKDYLEKNEEKVKDNTANKSLKELFTDTNFMKVRQLTYKIQSQGIVHPKLEKLRDILTSQLQENSESRILVFAHFRDSVNNIARYFKDDDIIKAHKFVGQAHKGSDKGLTQKVQIELLEKFKEGIYNTLIGTSVAEEGLDIAECDLVVFYDVVPSAIRSIQRRGRTGRKKEGNVLILMAEGTRDEGYYWAEKAKERNMRDSLKKIKTSQKGAKKEQANLLNFIEKKDNEIQSDHKIANAEQIEIACDNRETASAVVRNLSLMGVNLRLEQLSVGDYIISERVGIERKSSQDFTDSIKDGRLFKELKNLTDTYDKPILLLEEDPFDNSNLNENAIYGAITSIILNFGVTIYRTKDANETAMFLYQLAKKEQLDSSSSLKLRFDKAPIDTSRLLEFIIAGIPGVNSLRAKKLLREFKTLQNIFLADIPDLTKIENIGKKIAQEIYKISRYKYKNDH
ncbi:MAG: DEAD/DEAH box helicase [Candidatus Hermodarchaeota archaeon]